jgi:hypothetical protein
MKKILIVMIIAFTVCSGNSTFAYNDYYVDDILDRITQKIELPSGDIVEADIDNVDEFSHTEVILRADILPEEVKEEEILEEEPFIDIMELTQQHDTLINEWDSALNLAEDIIALELLY